MSEVCVLCGSTENIQKHHVSYIPPIIRLLCVDCHKKMHGGHSTGISGDALPKLGMSKRNGDRKTQKEIAEAYRAYIKSRGIKDEDAYFRYLIDQKQKKYNVAKAKRDNAKDEIEVLETLLRGEV